MASLEGIGLEEYAKWFHDAELREEADLIALASTRVRRHQFAKLAATRIGVFFPGCIGLG